MRKLVHTTMRVMLAPGCQLKVVTSESSIAIALARDALPFLQATVDGPEHALGASPGQGEDYTLTCLLCGAINPTRPGRSALVAMQEHQMEEHDLPAEAFQSAACISLVSMNGEEEERLVYAFPPALTALFGLPHSSYLRAVKWHKQQQVIELQQSSTLGLRTLAFQQTSDPMPELQAVYIVKEDEHAWYGYPHEALEDSYAWEPLVWPKGEWELVDSVEWGSHTWKEGTSI